MRKTNGVKGHEVFETLVGQECWSVSAGVNTGSSFQLNFGKKILREQPLRNQKLSEEERLYTGEMILYAQDCAWRIESYDKVITGSTDDKANDGPLVNNLNKLLCQRVESCELSFPSFDLVLRFSNSWSLLLFCDQMGAEDDDEEFSNDNYSFYTEQKIYTVGVRSKFLEELRDYF